MESTNAILLNPPEQPGDSYTFDDYVVKQEFTCIPQTPPAFEYAPVKMFDADGKSQPPSTNEDLRKDAEMYHRIRLEL